MLVDYLNFGGNIGQFSFTLKKALLYQEHVNKNAAKKPKPTTYLKVHCQTFRMQTLTMGIN